MAAVTVHVTAVMQLLSTAAHPDLYGSAATLNRDVIAAASSTC